MTANPQLPPTQQPFLAELESIGQRLESGAITPAEADALGDEVMVRLNRQVAVDAEAQVRLQLQARRTKALYLVAAIMVAATWVLLLR